MWIRADLKAAAKNALRGNWPMSVLVCLVAGILGVNLTGHANGSSARGDGGSGVDTLISSGLGTIFASLTVTVLVIALAVAIHAFLSNPVEVGLRRYFLLNRQEQKPEFGALFSPFKDTSFRNIVYTMIVVDLKILAGFFVFIIPGIYMSYCYRMVSYLMAVNPELTPQRAQELSWDMMNGHKWNTFILELSFIGWNIVSALTFGIGYLFLDPYKCATYAELYMAIREDALQRGIATWDELPEIYW